MQLLIAAGEGLIGFSLLIGATILVAMWAANQKRVPTQILGVLMMFSTFMGSWLLLALPFMHLIKK